MSSLKIMHLADLHIGMKFGGYPDALKRSLVEARFESLKRAVQKADEAAYDWIVISGDLFENLKVSKRDIERVNEILNAFSGDRVLVLPGNHDYYDETVSLWKEFLYFKSDKIVLLKACEVYAFTVDAFEIDVYAAPCFSKHSTKNQLGWIESPTKRDNVLSILVAHGAIRELSPDLLGNYFPMSIEEIRNLEMDLALLGHTHVPYPQSEETTDSSIFNAGTHEPDGLNYRYEGTCWGIEIDCKKRVVAKRIVLGMYRFYDHTIVCEDVLRAEAILKHFDNEDISRVVARIALVGYIDKEAYHQRQEVYVELYKHFAYLEIIDDGLKAKFTQDTIAEMFTQGSLPFVFLKNLIETHDAETAHLAYELMQEVIKRD